MSTGQLVPPIRTQLAAEVKQEAPAPVQTTPKVPKEAIDAVNEAQNLLKINVGDPAVVDEESGAATAPRVTIAASATRR